MAQAQRISRVLLLVLAGDALIGATPAVDPIAEAVAKALLADTAFAMPIRGNLTLPGTAGDVWPIRVKKPTFRSRGPASVGRKIAS